MPLCGSCISLTPRLIAPSLPSDYWPLRTSVGWPKPPFEVLTRHECGETVHLGEMDAESGALLHPLSAPFLPTLDMGLIQNLRPSLPPSLSPSLRLPSDFSVQEY
jgi:hypothetical protein